VPNITGKWDVQSGRDTSVSQSAPKAMGYGSSIQWRGMNNGWACVKKALKNPKKLLKFVHSLTHSAKGQKETMMCEHWKVNPKP